jgi:hypothetical protein
MVEIEVLTGKDRAAAVAKLEQYRKLKQRLIDEWGIGASVLKKYDIEPYLVKQEEFENALAEFGKLRKDYNELSDELRVAKVKEPGPEVDKLEQEWLEVGGKVQTLGSKDLKGVGAKFRKNLDGFDSTLKKLVTNLQKVETKTPKQRADLVALLQFLKGLHANVKKLANENYDFVQEAVDQAKARTPIT